MNKKRYFIKINSQHLSLLNKLNISGLHNDGQHITFYTDSTGFNFLCNQDVEFEYQDKLLTKAKFLFTRRIVSIIGIILLIVLLINQSFTITKYQFINPEYYNQDVIIFLDKYTKKVGPFRYLTASLSEINYQLRTEFFEYEWIGLKREGTILYIDIKKIDLKIPDDEDSSQVGDLVASKDAIVRYFYAQKGVVLVRELQAVSKGEVLITGNLLIHNEQTKYIRPKGFVIGEVLEDYYFSIPKEEIIEEKTGRLIEKKKITILNKKILSKKDPIDFKDYILIEKDIFKIGRLLKISNQSYYETSRITNYYTKEEAIEYAKSLVIKEFNLKKTTDYEKIIFIEVLKVIEGNNSYEIKLLVKKYENICVFREVK